MKIGRVLIPFVLGILVTLGVATFLLGNDNVVLISDIKYERLNKLEETYAKAEKIKKDLLDKFYLEVSEEDIEIGMYRGMFEATGDKYSRYFTKEELQAYNDSTNGNYVGIGILSDTSEGEIHITRVFPNSPAEKAGILAGDKVVEVDGYKLVDHDTDYLIDVMLGEEDTDIQVIVDRKGDLVTFNLQRGKIEIPFVTSTVLDDIGYLHIYQFGTDVSKDFEEHLNDLRKKDIKGLVIDLRNNPGGLVSESTKITDLLIGKGTIIYTLDNEDNRREYNSDAAKLDIPLVFLANGNSASASEIMLGAIKDTETAPIVGVQTFGKGIVQGITTLRDGSGYKLTHSQYFTPEDNVIHKVGVSPDYEVEFEGMFNSESPNPAEDLQLKKALSVMKEILSK